MQMPINSLVLASLCFLLATSPSSVRAENSVTVEQLAWLAGEWIGEGQEGNDGELQGIARLYWTPPLDGSIAWYFTWHMADSQHVHYAVNIFEQNENGLVGKGIHYGADFNNFEDHPWQLVATQTNSSNAMFKCVAHCRADSVSFTLLDGDILEERWQQLPDSDRPDWIVRYRRVD